MKIIWPDFASMTLKDIYNYHKSVAGIQIARKIKESIFIAAKHLVKFPEPGQIEISLKKMNESHRYLVDGHYKIIYKKISEGILITDVFDTRQDPIKMNDPQR